MNQVIIGVGSNIEPDKNICLARDIIKANFYWLSETLPIKTKAIGDANAADYLNCCYFIETKLKRSELKKELVDIEDQLGRIRNTDITQSRTIDLDIVIWNKKVVDEDFYSRDFLRKAVLELLPELNYPDRPIR